MNGNDEEYYEAFDLLRKSVRENGGPAYILRRASHKIEAAKNDDKEIARLRAALRRIAAMAGAPDPADACREILAVADEAANHNMVLYPPY